MLCEASSAEHSSGGRVAIMFLEPSAELANKRNQTRLQLTESVSKPSYRKRVLIGVRAFHEPHSHEPTVGHSSNAT